MSVKKDLLQQLKKPSLGKDTLRVQVTKYYTDISGSIIDKNTAPAALRTDLPVFMLGNFDRVGAFKIGQQIVQISPLALFLMSYVESEGVPPFLWNSGFNNVMNYILPGDIVVVYTDSYTLPTGFVFIVQSCGPYAALGSVVSNTQSIQEDGTIGFMECEQLYMQFGNPRQFDESLYLVRTDNLGHYKQDLLDPKIKQNPNIAVQTDFTKIPLKFLVTQYVGVYLKSLFATDSMIFNFEIAR